MFITEMLLPMRLPEDVSVIAWGLSLERSAHFMLVCMNMYMYLHVHTCSKAYTQKITIFKLCAIFYRQIFNMLAFQHYYRICRRTTVNNKRLFLRSRTLYTRSLNLPSIVTNACFPPTLELFALPLIYHPPSPTHAVPTGPQ